MTGDEVVAEARKWIGTPYRNLGRTAKGLDCLGLLVMLLRAFGVPHVDETQYSNFPRGDRAILTRLDEVLPRLAIPIGAAPAPGTVGVFAERRLPGHVGVFSRKHGVAHLIHARVNPRQTVEEAWGPAAKAELRLIGLFGFPGMS